MVLYWITTILLGIIQAGVNLYFEILPWGISLVDGLVFGFLLGAFGMAIWFVVRYNSSDDEPFAQILITNLAAAAILSVVWVYGASFVGRSVLPDPDYLTYHESHTTNRIFIGFLFFSLMATVF